MITGERQLGGGWQANAFFVANLPGKRWQILPFLPQNFSSSQKLPCVSEETANPIQLNLPSKTFANANPSQRTFASYCGPISNNEISTTKTVSSGVSELQHIRHN